MLLTLSLSRCLALSQSYLRVIPSLLCLFLSFSFASSFQHTTAEMAEAFVGTWNLKETKNFDEYMKALGRHVCAVAFVCVIVCVEEGVESVF